MCNQKYSINRIYYKLKRHPVLYSTRWKTPDSPNNIPSTNYKHTLRLKPMVRYYVAKHSAYEAICNQDVLNSVIIV